MLEVLVQHLAQRLGSEARVVPVSEAEALLLTPHYAVRCQRGPGGLEVALLLPHYADRRAAGLDLQAIEALAGDFLDDTARNRTPAFCDRRWALREAVGGLMARHGWREHRATQHAMLTTLVYANRTLFLAFFCDARESELDWAFFLAGSAAAHAVLGEGPAGGPRGGQLSRRSLLAARADRLPPDLEAALQGPWSAVRDQRAVLELSHVALDLLSGDDRPLLVQVPPLRSPAP